MKLPLHDLLIVKATASDKLRYISLSALIENILQVLQLIKNFFFTVQRPGKKQNRLKIIALEYPFCLCVLRLRKKSDAFPVYLPYELRFTNRLEFLQSQIFHSVLKSSEPECAFCGVHAQPDRLPEVLHSQILLPGENAVFL